MERRLSALSPTRAACLVTSLILAGCSADPGPRQTVADTTQTPSVTSQAAPMTPEPAAPQAETSAQEAIRVAASSPVPKPAPIAVAYSPVTVPPAEPVAAESAVVEAAAPKPTAKEAETPRATPTKAVVATTTDPGGVVEVTATKAGLTRIGAVKCKLCHQVQFASWTKTAHATRVPPLDCESCHGAGSEYKTLAIMKDPKKARAAGMVSPEAAFCAKCHTSGVTDDFLKKSHAHKAGA